MSSGTIVALIVAGIISMIIVAFTAQTLEANRQERHRRVLGLNDHARRLWNALHHIPAAYLPAEMRQFILAELQRCYREVLTLEPSNAPAKAQLKNISEANQQPYQAQLDSIKPVFTDHAAGQNIRRELKQLVNQLVQLHSEGLLDKTIAQQQINRGKALFALVTIDLSLLTARAMESSGKTKSAAIHYATCLKQLEKIHPFLGVPTRLEHLKRKVAETKAALQSKPAEAGDTPASSNEEWQRFVDSDRQDWKIKQDYE